MVERWHRRRTAGGQTDRQGGQAPPGRPREPRKTATTGLPSLPVRSTPTSTSRPPIGDVPDRVVDTVASAGERTNEQGGYTPAGRARANPGRNDGLEDVAPGGRSGVRSARSRSSTRTAAVEVEPAPNGNQPTNRPGGNAHPSAGATPEDRHDRASVSPGSFSSDVDPDPESAEERSELTRRIPNSGGPKTPPGVSATPG